jgi:hypothetical protein
MRSLIRCLGISAAALLIAGCGPKTLSQKSVYPVQGKVLLNGEPICMGLIELTPVTTGEGSRATGVVDAKGEFALNTYSNAEPDGAAPGEYKVAVKTFNSTEGGVIPAGVTPTKIPQRYADSDSSGLTVEITEDNGELTLTLEE